MYFPFLKLKWSVILEVVKYKINNKLAILIKLLKNTVGTFFNIKTFMVHREQELNVLVCEELHWCIVHSYWLNLINNKFKENNCMENSKQKYSCKTTNREVSFVCWMQVQLHLSNFFSGQFFWGVMLTTNTMIIPTLQILPLYSHDLYLLIF